MASPKTSSPAAQSDLQATLSDFRKAWRFLLLEAIDAAGLSREAVATQMGIPKGLFHKRCNGRTGFAYEEFAWLSERFALPRSPSELHRPALTFYPARPPRQSFDADAYLAGLEALQQRYAPRDASAEGSTLELVTSDLPVFWLLAYPELAALKRYVWEWSAHDKTTYRDPLSLARALGEQQGWLARAAKVGEAYRQIVSSEIWSSRPLFGVVSDVELLVERDLLPLSDLRHLFAVLHELTKEIQQAADLKFKRGGGALVLFQNDRHSTASTGILGRGTDQTLFLTFDVPSHLISHHPVACQYFRDYFAATSTYARRVSRFGKYTPRQLAKDLEVELLRSANQLGVSLNVSLLGEGRE